MSSVQFAQPQSDGGLSQENPPYLCPGDPGEERYSIGIVLLHLVVRDILALLFRFTLIFIISGRYRLLC